MKKYTVFLLCISVFGAYAATLQGLAAKCKKNNAAACHDLGYRYDQKGKEKQAAVFYRQACDLHHAMGCYRLAELYLVGSGVAQSDASFITYTQKACKLGYTKSCSVGQKVKSAKKRVQTLAKQPKNILIKAEAVGSIAVRVKYLDRQKRIIQIHASMTNHFGQASGWLSFSFPGIRQNRVVKSSAKGFDHIKTYPEGSDIYNAQQKKAMKSRYLLVEGETKHWPKRRTCNATITLKVPPGIKHLTLYVRGTFKRGKQIQTLPTKGKVGQQGFYNYRYNIPMGTGKQKELAYSDTVASGYTLPAPSDLPETPLTRRDKLMLLDQLFSLSYFHRERKAFEKQLQETLFGGATYLSFIKVYRCKPQKGSSKHRCMLTLAGEANKKNKPVRWEFHVTFSAKKEGEEPRILSIDTLDLLE